MTPKSNMEVAEATTRVAMVNSNMATKIIIKVVLVEAAVETSPTTKDHPRRERMATSTEAS